MNHLSYEEITSLAKATEDQIPYSDVQMEMMDHLETCKECFEKFCISMAVENVTSEFGYTLIPELFATNPAESAVLQVKGKVLVIIDVVKSKLSEGTNIILEQLKQDASAFLFQPTVPAAVRGMSETNDRIIRFEDLNDDKTFVVADPVRNRLLIQINTKGLGDVKLKITMMPENGKATELPLTVNGSIIQGTIKPIPEGKFRITVEKTGE